MVRLSKSQIGTFKQCPYQWKLKYIDNIKPESNKFQKRGSDIHKEIENFYQNVGVTDDKKLISQLPIPPALCHLYNFEKERIKKCKDLKNFYPLHQELRIYNHKYNILGIIDAVFLNDDDTLTVIDWKSGNSKQPLSKYRPELAFYTLLLENSKFTKLKVKNWGIFFTDQNKLLIEERKEISVKAVIKSMEKIRAQIESKDFPAKPGILCRWCNYNKICKEWQDAV